MCWTARPAYGTSLVFNLVHHYKLIFHTYTSKYAIIFKRCACNFDNNRISRYTQMPSRTVHVHCRLSFKVCGRNHVSYLAALYNLCSNPFPPLMECKPQAWVIPKAGSAHTFQFAFCFVFNPWLPTLERFVEGDWLHVDNGCPHAPTIMRIVLHYMECLAMMITWILCSQKHIKDYCE